MFGDGQKRASYMCYVGVYTIGLAVVWNFNFVDSELTCLLSLYYQRNSDLLNFLFKNLENFYNNLETDSFGTDAETH